MCREAAREMRVWGFLAWDLTRAAYALVLGGPFVATGAVFLLFVAWIATAVSLKGALVAAALEPFQPTFTSLEIGLSVLVLALIGSGVALQLWLEKESKRLETATRDRRAPRNRFKWVLFYAFHFVGLPLFTLAMLYVAISQLLLALKGAAWLFTGSFTLVGETSYPAALVPNGLEYAIAAPVALVLGLGALLVTYWVVPGARRLPYHPPQRTDEDPRLELVRIQGGDSPLATVDIDFD